MIISRTPYRISFFGGGTDYSAWSREHGGAVLAATLDKYCYLTCRYLPPFFEHKYRIVYSRNELCHTVDQIEHPAVRECLRYLEIKSGVEIHHDGDLPARSGMGTSSSFTIGLLHVLHALKGQMVSKRQLADEGIYFEQEILKENVGCQDQVLAAHGGFNHVEFLPNGAVVVNPIPLSAERFRELNSHLMLFFTGFNRTASVIADSYLPAIKTKSRDLWMIRNMVEESLAILSGNKDITRFGELLHEAWLAKRALSGLVSNTAIDAMYEEALAAGAVGGKLLGAGGGGFMLLFVPPDNHGRVRRRLANFLWVPFRFEFTGSQIIFLEHGEDYSALETRFSPCSPEGFQGSTDLPVSTIP